METKTTTQTEAQPLASKLSKKQRAANARRHRDEYFFANHGLTSASKSISMTQLATYRLDGVRKHSPGDSIRVRGEWYFNVTLLHELLDIAKSLGGRP